MTNSNYWTDDRLNQPAVLSAANAEAIAKLQERQETTAANIETLREQQQTLQATAEALIEEIRGLRAENRRVLAHLFGEQEG